MTVDVIDLLKSPEMTRVCAPMVRYSRLSFRTLVRKYNCDICFTPMILADSFVQSSGARDNEFSTNAGDNPLIVQFAAKATEDFINAAELVAMYCDGVDLNCGCPQRWAMNDGYGAKLLENPELVKDLVYQLRNHIPKPFTVSVKIRLLSDIKKSVEFCRILEHAGVSFLTVHARTPKMRREPIDLDGLKLIRESVNIPIIANGNVKTLEDAETLYNESKCQGVMAADGLLTNPGLFTGSPTTPINCVKDWIDITRIIPTHFNIMHHHLVFMLEKVLPKKERLIFNHLQSKEKVYDFINSFFSFDNEFLTFNDSIKPIDCKYNLKTNCNGDDVELERINNNNLINELNDSNWDSLINLFEENYSSPTVHYNLTTT